jgi:hypothetical protein
MLERYVLGRWAWKMEMVAWRMWITKAWNTRCQYGYKSEEQEDRQEGR